MTDKTLSFGAVVAGDGYVDGDGYVSGADEPPPDPFTFADTGALMDLSRIADAAGPDESPADAGASAADEADSLDGDGYVDGGGYRSDDEAAAAADVLPSLGGSPGGAAEHTYGSDEFEELGTDGEGDLASDLGLGSDDEGGADGGAEAGLHATGGRPASSRTLAEEASALAENIATLTALLAEPAPGEADAGGDGVFDGDLDGEAGAGGGEGGGAVAGSEDGGDAVCLGSPSDAAGPLVAAAAAAASSGNDGSDGEDSDAFEAPLNADDLAALRRG